MQDERAVFSIPEVENCYFYHTMEYPDGQKILGTWTIPSFSEYIGGYNVSGKSVLDVGTASGWLTFEAEKAGASVLAIDAPNGAEIRQVPFACSPAYLDRTSWQKSLDENNLCRIKNSWLYSWFKYQSKATVDYRTIDSFMTWGKSFDIVIAGAIIEHISDPIYSLGCWSKVAREAILIPFTDVILTEDLMMRPMTDWTDPRLCYAWWQLSWGLYRRVLDNLGFTVELTHSTATHNDATGGPMTATRPTIVAVRR